MARQLRFVINGETVSGQDLEFEPLQERWNEYRCEDGSLVKIRLVVSKIVKLDRLDPFGQPIYQIVSTNVVSAAPPDAPS